MFWLSYESFFILSDVFCQKVSFPAKTAVKRKDSQETQTVLTIYLLELGISGVAIEVIHQKTAKNGNLLGTAQ